MFSQSKQNLNNQTKMSVLNDVIMIIKKVIQKI